MKEELYVVVNPDNTVRCLMLVGHSIIVSGRGNWDAVVKHAPIDVKWWVMTKAHLEDTAKLEGMATTGRIN